MRTEPLIQVTWEFLAMRLASVLWYLREQIVSFAPWAAFPTSDDYADFVTPPEHSTR